MDVRHYRSEGLRRASSCCLRPPPCLVMMPACCVCRTPASHILRLQNMCRISYSASVGGRHPLCRGQSVLAAILAFRCKTSVAICVWSRRRCQSSAVRRTLSSAGRWCCYQQWLMQPVVVMVAVALSAAPHPGSPTRGGHSNRAFLPTATQPW